MNDSPSNAPDIARNPEFRSLAKRKNSLSLLLTLVICGVYFGFIGLLAFAPEVLSARVFGGAATLGIPLGIGVIVLAWILTGIYVRWANGAYDSMVAKVKDEAGKNV